MAWAPARRPPIASTRGSPSSGSPTDCGTNSRRTSTRVRASTTACIRTCGRVTRGIPRGGLRLRGLQSAETASTWRARRRPAQPGPDAGYPRQPDQRFARWFAAVGYRPSVKDLFGADAAFQETFMDVRSFVSVTKDRRHRLRRGCMETSWVWNGAVLRRARLGVSILGRSGRGYTEGRFRGDQLLYGELEYRATLTRNGLLGMVAFVNTTTLAKPGDRRAALRRLRRRGGVGSECSSASGPARICASTTPGDGRARGASIWAPGGVLMNRAGPAGAGPVTSPGTAGSVLPEGGPGTKFLRGSNIAAVVNIPTLLVYCVIGYERDLPPH